MLRMERSLHRRIAAKLPPHEIPGRRFVGAGRSLL